MSFGSMNILIGGVLVSTWNEKPKEHVGALDLVKKLTNL